MNLIKYLINTITEYGFICAELTRLKVPGHQILALRLKSSLSKMRLMNPQASRQSELKLLADKDSRSKKRGAPWMGKLGNKVFRISIYLFSIQPHFFIFIVVISTNSYSIKMN